MKRANTILANILSGPFKGHLLFWGFFMMNGFLFAQLPTDITISCTDKVDNLSLTGKAQGTYKDESFINDCGTGYILRKWSLTNTTNTHTQRITVKNNNPLKQAEINWPKNYEKGLCLSAVLPKDLPSSFAKPIIPQKACARTSVNYEDEMSKTGPQRILRKWTVIDWCQYDPDSENKIGYFEHTQYINVLTSNPPAFSSAPDEQLFCIDKRDCGSTHITLVTSALDDCTPSNHLIYSFKIDLDSDGVADKTGEGQDASGDFPLGQHSINWYVTDGCGNVSTSSYDFTILDCQQPKAYCLNGTSITLEPSSGMTARVYASELDLSSMDNCGIAELRIASPSGGPGQSIPPPAADFIEFDCRQLGMHSVDVWVKDEGGNWDFCTTYLNISDSKKNCEDEAVITKTIKKQEQEGDIQLIESVTITEKLPESQAMELYQNYPNPFSNETSIRFYLPRATHAKLSVFDTGGRLLQTIENNYPSGIHNIQLKKSGLAGHNVLYYQLETDEDTKSMMMLLID